MKDAPTVACDTQILAIEELRNVLRNWSGQKDISRAQPPSKVPHAVLPRVRNQKLSDMSENLGALRAMPKESIPNIALPIPSPWKSPSVSPPRVPKPSGRESPRSPVRFSTIIEEIPEPAQQQEDSPISTRTRFQRQSVADKPIASRTRSQLSNNATTVSHRATQQGADPLAIFFSNGQCRSSMRRQEKP